MYIYIYIHIIVYPKQSQTFLVISEMNACNNPTPDCPRWNGFFPSQDNDIVSLMMKRVYDIAASTSNRIKAATASMDWFVGENLTRKPEIFP